jgi:hypothetical protein
MIFLYDSELLAEPWAHCVISLVFVVLLATIIEISLLLQYATILPCHEVRVLRDSPFDLSFKGTFFAAQHVKHWVKVYCIWVALTLGNQELHASTHITIERRISGCIDPSINVENEATRSCSKHIVFLPSIRRIFEELQVPDAEFYKIKVWDDTCKAHETYGRQI